MVEDRFYEPPAKSMEEQAYEAYQKYMDGWDYNDGEPMNFEQYYDYFWRY